MSKDYYNTKEIISFWESFQEEKNEKDYLTIYINFPYCMRECSYCVYHRKDLTSWDQIDDWLDEISVRASVFKEVLKSQKISAISLGGGTPSLMEECHFERLFDILFSRFDIDLSTDNMFTMEVSPESLNRLKLKYLCNSPINRIGLGIQTFNEEILEKENRLNQSRNWTKEIIHTLKNEAYGFYVDLMWGLMDQTHDDVLKDFEELQKLGVDRIQINALRKRVNEESFIEDLKVLKEKILQNFNYTVSDKDSASCNRFFSINDDQEKSFKYWYSPNPVLWNNVLGLGWTADSFITPLQKYFIEVEDKDIYYNKDNSEYNMGKRFGEVLYQRQGNVKDLDLEKLYQLYHGR